MLRIVLFIFFCALLSECIGQYNWKLEKSKDGIQIYSSEIPNATFRAVKVECTFDGTIPKLISILTQITQYPEWVYNSKTTYLLKQTDPFDLVYYTETRFPWPFSNRDAIIHLKFNHDSLSKTLSISGTNESTLVPVIFDKVRVPHYYANWAVTSPAFQKIQISYILEADPGGNIPSWLSSMFIDKGPYETFKKLGEKLAM